MSDTKFTQSGNWILLPQNVQGPSSNSIFLDPIETSGQARKRSVMSKLFQVGVIFEHKGSKILWEVIEVVKGDDGAVRFAKCKSKQSGYKKAFWPNEYTYDSLNLHEAPDALRVLFGDEKHVKGNVETPSIDPQEAEQAFDIDLSEDPIE